MAEGAPASTVMGYSLEGSVEIERLEIHTRVWEPETESMLAQIDLPRAPSCIDLGCGPIGVLGPLSRKAGVEGRVVGLDMDRRFLELAATRVKSECEANVELLQGDAYATGLPSASFDFVHERGLIGPLGHADDVLAEMLRLVKPGGVIAMQEPDHHTLRLFPRCVAYEALVEILGTYFVSVGGDPASGHKIFQLLHRGRLRDIQLRGSMKVLKDGHPYMRMMLLALRSARAGIVDAMLATDRELDRIAEAVEERLREPGTYHTTITLVQSWGTR